MIKLSVPLIGRVLERASVEAVTLEVEELTPALYHEQVQLMRRFLEGR